MFFRLDIVFLLSKPQVLQVLNRDRLRLSPEGAARKKLFNLFNLLNLLNISTYIQPFYFLIRITSMSKEYRFITQWKIKAPLPQVWDAIYDSLNWPDWWKGVLAVKDIEKGGAHGVGGIRRYTWKSVLPYTLSFNMRLTQVQDLSLLEGEAFGELEGEGRWLFIEQDGITHVEYHWNVITRKSWMNYLSFLLKPAFKYNHDVVMRWGAKGLANKLNAELLRY